MDCDQPKDSLSPEKIQLFTAGLSGLAPAEVRKAKSLYLRNALSEFRMAKDQMANFGIVQIFFAIIPLFWPFLIVQRRMMKTGLNLYQERIRNALTVWKEDLGDEYALLEQELNRLQAG